MKQKKQLPLIEIGVVRDKEGDYYVALQDKRRVVCSPIDWMHVDTWSGPLAAFKGNFRKVR